MAYQGNREKNRFFVKKERSHGGWRGATPLTVDLPQSKVNFAYLTNLFRVQVHICCIKLLSSKSLLIIISNILKHDRLLRIFAQSNYQCESIIFILGFPGGSDGKESAYNVGDLGSIPGLGRSPGGGHGNLLQYSCLENPHGQRSRVGSVHGVTKSRTRLNDEGHTQVTFIFYCFQFKMRSNLKS